MEPISRAESSVRDSGLEFHTLGGAESDAAAHAAGADVIDGLRARPKTLPPRYFYDTRGSRLFDRITGLPEYYLTRTEQRILADCAGRLGAAAGAVDLVELGSGSARKTGIVIEALLRQVAGDEKLRYVPIDVSAAALEEGSRALAASFPRLDVKGLVGTYEAALAALPPRLAKHRLMMFLGSTIGNLDPAETAAFLGGVAGALAPGDALLLGFDLVKTPGIIDAAYNDAQGVTALFNLNMLRHLNRRFDGDFDLAYFAHRAFFDPASSRIEMHLVSAGAQTVRLKRLDLTVRFEPGESIRTEISRKFRLPEMREAVERHGFRLERRWSDDSGWFAVALFRRM